MKVKRALKILPYPACFASCEPDDVVVVAVLLGSSEHSLSSGVEVSCIFRVFWGLYEDYWLTDDKLTDW